MDFPTPKKNVVVRHEENPILTPDDMPVACCGVYNSGVTRTPEGKYVMFSRFEYPSKLQRIWVSRSDDGVHFVPDSEPMQFVCDNEYDMDRFQEVVGEPEGAMLNSYWDPRVTRIGDKYYIVYAAKAGGDVFNGIAVTTDFKTAEHVSFPMHSKNHGAALFPELINGEFWMLHRPEGNRAIIWIASSPDLHYWGKSRPIADLRHFWEWTKIGPGAPPIRTDHGWLEIYHGVFPHCDGRNYGFGAMLLDLEQPWKVIARTDHALLFVAATYEMIGQVPNVIYPCGAVLEDDGTVKIYYGAADYVQCLAIARLDDLIDACFNR